MAQMAINTPMTLNGFQPAAIEEIARVVTEDPDQGLAEFRVRSEWTGRASAEAHVEGFTLGGRHIERRHVIRSDEPREFFGGDEAPNPQELLFAALNACMLYGYATGAAVMGIEIERMSIQTRGRLDLRGAMGLAPIPPGCEKIEYAVRIKAKATREQLEELHARVMATSPNFYHLTKPIRLAPQLIVET